MIEDSNMRNPLGQPAHSQQRAGQEGINRPSLPGTVGNHAARISELERRLRRKIEPVQRAQDSLVVTTLERNASASLPFTVTAGGSLTIDASYFDVNVDGGDTSGWWDDTDGLTRAGIFNVGLKMSWPGTAADFEWSLQHNANWWHGREHAYAKGETIDWTATCALSPGSNQLEWFIKNLGPDDWSVNLLRARIAPVLFIEFIDATF